MRASVQEQRGGIGAHEVTADFERIGWGVAENSQHDLGTDLFLMARDHRLIDLGMVVGAQVKAGPTFFREEARDEDGNVTGWWFRESKRDHFDAWLSHQLPHIIVLRNLDTRTSYWAQITDGAVEYTDKGAKIFVPADQIVDAANADKLLGVAASKASRVTWEGSAWGGAELSPSHQLRHALLVPRLIAPHPNRSCPATPIPVQVIAMLVQVRLLDIAELGDQHASLPDLNALPSDAAWDWKFAAAVLNFITEGGPDVLKVLVDIDRPPHEQAAATVVYAAAMLEDGRAEDALDALDALLGRNELDLVDHAWVQLQHARALSELGRRQEARDEALNLVSLAQRAPGDVTAAAIGGAAAHTVFAVSDWGTRDIKTTISAADTTASWWRQQVSSWGISAQAEKLFRTWGRDSSVTLGGEDEAWRYLRSASLLAGLLGDHRAWRHATKQLAGYVLTHRDHGVDQGLVTTGLTMLSRCGDHKGLGLAVRRVVTEGPAAAAQSAALRVKPKSSTHTAAQADLRMLIEAGDLFPRDRAEELADWAQRTFLDPGAYAERTHPTFLLRPILVDLMSALVEAVGEQAQHQMADFVLDLPAQSDQSTANRLARLVQRLPATVWTLKRAQRAADRASGDNWELTYPLLGIAAPRMPEVRERLKAEAREGSLPALFALGNVRELNVGLVKSVIERITSRLENQIQEVAQGRLSGGGPDLGYLITLLNLWHPECANWAIVYRLLASTRWGEHLTGALNLLANRAADLPDDVATKLAPLAEAIASGPDVRPVLFQVPDPRPPARRLQVTLQRSAEESIGYLSTLARGNLEDRRAAALLARNSRDELSMGVLIALAGDHEPRVRAAAARVIAERAAAGESTARAQLPFLIEDGGVLVAKAIAAATREHRQLADFDELRPLRTHISAQVRVVFSGSTEL
ncbi:DUF4365 domain-containing protein [Micromonospora gifhornensis]|uniref:DUF4365 domain-containing protein n=1 Tax=Micromonospora gifhornensis TaxID=84594 RepID=UPI003457266F